MLLATLVHFSALSVGQPELKDVINSSPVTVKELPQEFPNYTGNYEKTVVTPCTSGGGHLEGYTCVIPPPPPETMDSLGEGSEGSETGSTQAVDGGISGLIGSYGYISPMSNCVDFVKMFGKNQPGDPLSWIPTSQTPWVGAAAIFDFNHVGMVTGIWPDGSLEIAHANCPGCATHWGRGEIRGFF